MYVYLYRSGEVGIGSLITREHIKRILVRHFSQQPFVRRRHSIETALIRVVDDLNTCMELGSKSVLLSLDISAAFDTIDSITVWAGVSLISIVPHRQIMLRGHQRSQVWHLELRFWRSSGKPPWTCPLLRLRISHLKDHGVSRDQVSSIRRRYSTLHGCLLPGSIPNGGSHDVCRLCCSGSSTMGYNCTQTSRTMILGSRQGLPRLEPVVSDHWRWSHGGKRRNHNPWRSSGSNLVYECSIEGIDQDIQLSHPCSPTGMPRSDSNLPKWSPSVSSLLGFITSRLDYCNSLLCSTSKLNIGKLQRVQNDLERVVLQAAWNSSSKPLLKQLNWLQVHQRITFKIAHHIQREVLNGHPISTQSDRCRY